MPQEIAPNQSAKVGASALANAARNLQERIVSAVVMVAAALFLAYAGAGPFAVLILAFALLMSWEWGHLVRGVTTDIAFAVHGVAVAVAIGLAASGGIRYGVFSLAAGALAVAVMARDHRPVLSALGVAYTGLPAVALVWLRGDPGYGFAALIFLLVTVWTTDTMAYVFGKTFGGAKLWVAVSPNKTWAGFLGGVVSSALIAASYAGFITGASSLRLGAIGLALGLIAQAGDLAESALKRKLGVKDASHIIPGHGGVMDRMDGVVTVALAAALFALIWNAAAPATAILIGR